MLIQSAPAITPGFRYVQYEKETLFADFSVPDSLPAQLIGYIEKGVPVSFEYEIELWEYRTGWFDKLLGKANTLLKVRFDPWEKVYSVIRTSGDLSVEHILNGQRETLDLLKSSGRLSFPVNDSSGLFYLVGSVKIKTMTFSNYREVESWLKGEISEAGKPELDKAPSAIGEFVFDMALKVSGLKDISREIKTERFRINSLPLYPGQK